MYAWILAACVHHPPVVSTGPAPAPVNLDFEAGAGPAGFPVGWAGGGEGYALTLDSNGRASGRIAAVGGGEWGALTQCVEATPWAGQRLQLRGQLRTEDAGGAGLWMRVDRGDRSVAFDNMANRARVGTNDWASATVVLDVPSDATRVCCGLLLRGKGVAWVDDLALEAVGSDVATTTVPRPRLAPLNLGFEDGMVGWAGGGEGYALDTDAVTRQGAAAGRLRWSATRKPGRRAWGALTQCVAADAWRGQRVRFDADLRTDSAGKAGLWLRVDADDGSVLAFDNMDERAIVGTSDWGRPAIVADVATNAETVCFGVVLSGGGTAWIDDLRFESVGAEVAVTAS